MTQINKIYPSLPEVINLEIIPKFLSFVKDFLEDKGQEVFVKNLQISQSFDDTSGAYSMDLYMYKPIDFPIVGELAFVIAPPTGNPPIGNLGSIYFEYDWPLIKYINQISQGVSNQEFSVILENSLEIILDMLIDMSGITPDQLLSQVLNIFYDGDDLNTLNTEINTLLGSSNSILTDPNASTAQKTFDLTNQILESGESIANVVYNLIIDVSSYSISEKIESLRNLFESILDNVKDNLEDTLIPEIDFRLTLPSVGIRFPKSWLRPIDPLTHVPYPDTSAFSYLSIDNIGGMSYSTEEGFGYAETPDTSINLPLSQIANTPLTISIQNLKVDLKENSNIPEATADGRTNSFKGIYIEEAIVGLPNIFAGANSFQLVTKNMLIGTEGGVSGTVGVSTLHPNEVRLDFEIGDGGVTEIDETSIYDFLIFDSSTHIVKIKGIKKVLTYEVVDGTEVEVINDVAVEKDVPVSSEGIYIIDSENNIYPLSAEGLVTNNDLPAGILNFNIGSTVFTINNFYLTFNKNKIVSSTVNGSINVPSFENNLLFEIDFSNGFKVLVYPNDDEGEVVMNDPVELTLEELELGKADEKLYLRFQGVVKPKVNLPIIGKYIPEVLDINNLLWKESDGLNYDINLLWKNGLEIGVSSDGPPQLSAFKKTIPINKKKEGGFFNLDAIDYELKPIDSDTDGNGGGIEAGAYLRGAKFTFAKAVTFAIDKLGIKAVITKSDSESNEANVGPFKIVYKVVEPSGIGVAIDAKAVTGSGYLDFNKAEGEYTGHISLKVGDLVTVTAIGVLNTKMPDGGEGYSFAVLISATGLGIPLFADFILDGLGGMLGIHRTVDTDTLRTGLRNKTMDSVLFPEITKDNLTKVITDFKRVFPVKKKQFLFGPMARITKGKGDNKTTIDLGFIVEFPNPLRLVLLGDINIGLGKKDEEVLMINVAFLGEVNITEKRILFDASIYDSRLAKFTIEGDMAFRLFWGEQKGFIMTVGGFHPDYTPPQHLMVNDVRRIRINFLTGNDHHFFIESYFAITSNTVQFGALADLKFKFSKFLIKGQLGFDVLFQFNPFRFSVGVHAYVGIFWGSKELIGIGFSGKIAGTDPWTINGKVKFKVLLVNFTARFNKTWGEKSNALLEAIDVETLVADELTADKNWKVIMPDYKTQLVSYTVSNQEDSSIYVHPLGSLSVEQSVVPMGINLEHFENHNITGAKRFEVNQLTIGSQVVTDFTPTYDDFAPAQFLKMSDKEKLASKSYEQLKNGVQASGDSEQDFETFVACSADYDKTLIDVSSSSDRVSFDDVHTFMNHYQFVKGGGIKSSPLSRKIRVKKERVLDKAVSIPKSGFAVVDEDLNYYNNDAATYTLNTRAEAQDIINQLIESDPYLDGELTIVPEFELEV